MCRKHHFQHGPGGASSFYHALFHELAHWTEPRARCGWWDTPEVNELRAEIAADFLATEFAVPDYPYRCRRNVHKHLEIWINEMRRRPRLISKVAASAAKAVDYILGYTLKVEPRHEAIWDEAV